MDIDEFLDRELSDFDSSRQKTSGIDNAQLSERIGTSSLFESIKTSLEQGKLEDAELSYIQLWHVLAQANFKWDENTYGQMLSFSRQILGAINNASGEIALKTQQINDFLSKARAMLKDGKRDEALKSYSQAQEMQNTIPGSFFEERKNLHDQLMLFYQELKSSNEIGLINKVFSLINEIRQLTAKSAQLFGRGEVSNAAAEYSHAVRLYNQIPVGFLKHKGPIGMQLLDIYKKISIYTEITALQKQLGSMPNQHSSLTQNISRGGQIPQSRIQKPVVSSLPNLGNILQEHKTQKFTPIEPQITQRINVLNNLQKNSEIGDIPVISHPAGNIREKINPVQLLSKPQKIEMPLKIAEKTAPKKEETTKLGQQSIQKQDNPVLSRFMEEEKYADQNRTQSNAENNISKSESKISGAKINIERGFYNEAAKDVEGALKISPNDVEAKVLMAKIKAWQ